jgi:hypothetical protein
MKKIIFSGMASALLIFTGCTTEVEKAPKVDLDTAKKTVLENPENLYFDLEKASGQNTIDLIDKYIPDKEIFVKNEGDFSIDGEFNLEGTPVGGGGGTFSIKGDAQMDYSNPKNPLLKENIDIDVNVMGGLFKVKTNGEIRIVENSIFTNIKNLDFNFPGVTPDIKEISNKFLNSWYGDSFVNLEKVLKDVIGAGEIEFELKDMFAGGNEIINILNLIEDVSKNPKKYITFVRFIEEKNNYFFFEISAKKEFYNKGFEIISKILPMEDKVISDMKNELQKLETQTIIIAYTPENSKYFIAETKDKSVRFENTKEKQFLSIKPKDKKESILYEKIGENITITLNKNGKKYTPLIAVKKDNSFTFEVKNVDIAGVKSDVVIAKGEFTKNDDKWSGKVESTENFIGLPKVSLEIKDLFCSTNELSGSLIFFLEKTKTLNINIRSNIKKLDSLKIEKPVVKSNFKELFENITEDFIKIQTSKTSTINLDENYEEVNLDQNEEKIKKDSDITIEKN